uniref:CCDC92 domain-containing protein n=1 Tax=Macrostomum lignano TaxID=282301 RepID=A0A1I8IGS3_9PLAT
FQQDPIMEDEAANSNSDLVDAETEVAAPSSEEAAAPDEAANEGQTGQVPPPMPVVEAPSPIASDVEDDAEDHLEESQPPPQNGADAAQQADEDAEVNRGVCDEEPHQAEQEDDHGNEDGDQEDDEDENGAALLQQLSESLRQQTDSSDRDQRDSQSHSRDEADRQLDNHRRELDQLQSNLRRELAEEKRQLDQRLARRQQGLPAGDSAAGEDRPSRLTLDNPIHMALNLRPDNSVRSYLPAEMLSSRQGAASTSAVGQHRVLPSTLTSEELRLLDDVRQRLSRASIEEQQQQQPPLPPPQPRPRQQQRQPPYRHRVADPAPFAQVAPDSDGYEEGIDPLVRSTHERLAG